HSRAVFRGAAVEHHLEQLEVNVVREHCIENLVRVRFKQVYGRTGLDWSRDLLVRGTQNVGDFETSNRKHRPGTRSLGQRVYEVGENDRDLVDVAFQELVHAKLRNLLGLKEGEVFLQDEFGQHLAIGTREILHRTASNYHEDRVLGMELGNLAEEVGVQGSAQSLVGADHDDQFLFH